MSKKKKDVKESIKKKLDLAIKVHEGKKIRILLMLSGGVDSMVLAYNLIELRSEMDFDLGFFHLDHMFRGEESYKDYKFVRNFAEKNDVPCYSYRRNISKIAGEKSRGFELCARETRHSLAKYVSFFNNYQYIATAHHEDDNAESIFLNFIRGAGLKGLSGMSGLSENYIRPMLDLSKKQILEFAEINTVEFREDATNLSSDYTRNKIRLDVIPTIKEINPNFSSTITRTGSNIKEDLSSIEELVDLVFSNISTVGNNYVYLKISDFRNFSKAIKRRIVRKTISFLNFDLTDVYSSAIDEIINLSESEGIGKYVDYRGIRFEIRQNQLICVKMQAENIAMKTPVKLLLGKNFFGGFLFDVSFTGFEEKKENDDFFMVISEEIFKRGLELRYREPQDFIRPARLKGKKKSLKKLFIEHKLNSIQKQNTPLLCFENEVIWAVGIEKSIESNNLLTNNKKSKNFIAIKAYSL